MPQEPGSQDIGRECGADFQQVGLHRGAAFGDLDNDGRIDAVVTRLNETVELFHNQTEPSVHFLLLKLLGTGSNPDGLGASVRVVLARLFHLWHRENDRSRRPENRARLDELLRSDRIRAAQGLDRFLGAGLPA